MKKIICCLVVIVLSCILLTGCGIFDSKNVTVDGVSYVKAKYKRGDGYIEGYRVVGCKSGVTKLVIAEEVKGLPVLSICLLNTSDDDDE